MASVGNPYHNTVLDYIHQLVFKSAVYRRSQLLRLSRLKDEDILSIDQMTLTAAKRSTKRKTVTVSLCLPQIPHGLAWDLTRASAVTGRQITSSAMARTASRTKIILNYIYKYPVRTAQ